jgi:glycogen operon protein
VRKFWRGDPLEARHLATRLSGSSDLYLRDGRKPFHSINFITSHDGFTLRDLVTYTNKHNAENGEENRDGGNSNNSANYGFEGPSKNAAIENLRERQTKNFFATLMVSLGTPMILGGDEFGRTQQGNNNAYCQDNEISWYDWSLPDKNRGLLRFVREIIAFRLRHQGFMRPEFYTGRDGSYNAIPDITWFDETGNPPVWEKIDGSLALRIDGSKADIRADRDDNDFFIMFNSRDKQTIFTVCEPPEGKLWFRAVDTGFPSPDDILSPGCEWPLPAVNGPAGGNRGKFLPDQYPVKNKSMVILISKEIT